MPSSIVSATTTIDASWIVVPVVVLVIALAALQARHGGGAQAVARAAPNAVVSIVGTVLVAIGGGATALAVGFLPIAVIIEAVGGHILGPLFLALIAAVATLVLGAVLLGRGLRELMPRRR